MLPSFGAPPSLCHSERSEESRILPSLSISGRGRASSAGEGQNSKMPEILRSPHFQSSRSQASLQIRIQPRRKPMSSSDTPPRKFRIEGSGQMLGALAQAIELALRAARTTPDREGAGSVARGPLTIDVDATNYKHDDLRYVITSIDDAVSTIAGWAEAKRCDPCEEPVALLFDDAYLETRNGEGVICCECYRRIVDGEDN